MAKIMVVGLDDGPLGEVVLKTALDVASDTDDCEVHAIHVGIDDSYGADADAQTPRVLEYVRAVVSAEVQSRSAAGWRVPRVFVHSTVGDPARQITRLAEKLRGGLVVVGTGIDSTFDRVVLGSVAARVLRQAPCSVLVVRAPSHRKPSRGVDPACPDCRELREVSRRTTLFCDRHADDDVYVEVDGRHSPIEVVASS